MLTGIQNIIFDIGNVLIDIDYEIPVARFQELATVKIRDHVSYEKQDPLFDDFETGKITPNEFRQALKKFLQPGVTNEQIDEAWNSIFTDFPQAKFELVTRLKSKYRVLALSNINDIHLNTCDRMLQQKFGAIDMRSYFHYACYSHEVGYRKPEKEIYEHILRHENLNPAETLFIDDKPENIEGAVPFGIRTYHLADRNKLLELFAEG